MRNLSEKARKERAFELLRVTEENRKNKLNPSLRPFTGLRLFKTAG